MPTSCIADFVPIRNKLAKDSQSAEIIETAGGGLQEIGRLFTIEKPAVHTQAARSSQIWTRRDSAGDDFRYAAAVKIEKGRRVRLKVELTAGSDVIEKSVVEFVSGAGTMLPGLEAVLAGLEPGARREGTLAARDAFGNPAMHPVKQMKRGEFPADAELKPGTRFFAKGADNGLDVVLQIEKVSGDTVETRLVHPLADKDLAYKFEVVQVTDPRPPPMPVAALKLEENDELTDEGAAERSGARGEA